MLPLLVIGLELLLAIPILIRLAPHEPHDEFAIFVHDVFAAAAGDVNGVAVEQALRDEGQFGEDRGVPLDNVFL